MEPIPEKNSVELSDAHTSREKEEETPRTWLSFLSPLNGIWDRFSPFERVAFFMLFLVLLSSSLVLLQRVNVAFMEEVPTRGGTHTEGVLGSPRFINPLLATSDTDRDLTSLVYAGLMRPNTDGELVPDLAQSYTVSEDGLTYTFALREDAYFHDNTPVTAHDVVFTIARVQDIALKSPRRASWDGVSVEYIGPYEVSFTLSQPYAPFLENATLGILPKHIWEHADAEEFPFSIFNTEPVGAGMFQVRNIERDPAGIPLSITLKPSSTYHTPPNISQISFRFYGNEEQLVEAFNEGDVDALHSIKPETLSQITRTDITLYTAPLPRIFSLFFNQNRQDIFTDERVRKAIDHAISRETLIETALHGYAEKTHLPFPPHTLTNQDDELLTREYSPEKARELLEDAGWVLNEESGVREKGDAARPLTFLLSTANIPELRQSAEYIKGALGEVGIAVEVQVFEPADLTQNVIRPRSFDMLLFGIVVGRELDQYAFWHSSQRNDPGLNISQYANITADRLLESARKTGDREEQLALFREFAEEIHKEAPALFLYTPQFIYLVRNTINNVDIGVTTHASERFLSLPEWHTETEFIWSFIKNI